jgi:hypothetical protein
MKISPTVGQPELYLLKDDEGCELLYKRMAAYHWKIDSAGNPTDTPDDEDDDLLDAQRYLIMNVFSVRNKIVAANMENIKDDLNSLHPAAAGQYTEKNWMSKLISEATGDTVDDDIPSGIEGNSRFKFVP